MRLSTYALFVLWASVCSFAPEVIWQGFLIARRHFGAPELSTALFIAVLFTFFVEPLVERLKGGHAGAPHSGVRGSVLLNALLSVAVGVAVVCTHEAMAAYFSGAHGHGEGKQDALDQAIQMALEWAAIPAGVTTLWLATATRRTACTAATLLAGGWALVVGLTYGWRTPVVLTTAVICSVITRLGAGIVARSWSAQTRSELAKAVSLGASGCLALAVVVDLITPASLGRDSVTYPLDQVFEDLRFYAGWAFGLWLAPNPTMHATKAEAA